MKKLERNLALRTFLIPTTKDEDDDYDDGQPPNLARFMQRLSPVALLPSLPAALPLAFPIQRRCRFSSLAAMDALKLLTVRLGAARVALNDCTPEQRVVMSRTQALAVVDLVKRAGGSLTREEAADLSVKIMEVKWCADDATLLLKAVQPKSAITGGTGTRRGMQNYNINLLEFFTAAQWDTLEAVKGSKNGKLELIMSVATRAGLRCPSEHSLKFLTSIWLLLSVPSEELASLDASSKALMLSYVKKDFARYVRKLEDPPEWVIELPPPMKLHSDYPATFKKCFEGRAEVVACRLALDVVISFDSSYSCRGGKVAPTPQLHPRASPSVEDVVAPKGIMQMAMQFMQAMQANQNKMFEMIANIQGQSCGKLKSLEQESMRRQPLQLQLEGPIMPLSPSASKAAAASPPASPSSSSASSSSASSLVSMTPQNKTSRLHEEMSPPAVAAPAASMTDSSGPDGPAGQADIVKSSEASERLQQCLSMLAERSKACKRTRKQESAGDEDPEVAPLETAATSILRRKPKKTAKAKTVSWSLAVKDKAKDKTKIDAKGKKAEKGAKERYNSAPQICFERTRNQIQCRTGLRGPGQYLTMGWGEGRAYASEADAHKAAKAWLAKETLRQKKTGLI